jgi:hypothetical protein
MKKVIFWALIIAIQILIIDLIIYYALFKVNQTRNLFYERTDITKERIDFWLANSYSPVLGWDLPAPERNNLGTRREEDYPAKEIYKIKTFGDSFTYGAEVGVDDTWQAFVEAKTDWECLNYGVGAFGTDQAFLKYQMNGVKTEYTVLGVLSENIGRVASIYPAFYMRDWSPPKPRFIKRNGSIELVENPISSPDSAYKLLDAKFVDSLKKLDYWPYYYEEKLGAPAKLKWPAMYTVLGHLPFFFKRAKIEYKRKCCESYETEVQTFKYYHLYERPNAAFEILANIIEKFITLSHQRGEYPIILIFPDQFSIDIIKKYNRNPYQSLADFLHARGVDFLDFGELFAKEDYEPYFNFYNSHFSPQGNARVADELILLIKKLEEKASAGEDVL